MSALRTTTIAPRPGKTEQRYRRAERQAEDARHRHGADADLERQQHDLAQVAVEVIDEGEGRREGLGDVGHAWRPTAC